jgi:prepilin-type N-terminal cleavage/methylation domain-containing protein
MQRRRQQGFTLVELAIVVVLIGVLAAAGAPLMLGWLADQRLKEAARGGADAFQIARAEAIRTGNHHVVFFWVPPALTSDPGGNPIEDATGQPVAALILDDGPPATANCEIDPGEPTRTVALVPGVTWGATRANVLAPLDASAFDPSFGVTFADPGGVQVNWVVFRPDGIPVAFDAACTLGTTGSGGGGLYVTNNDRDYAITLSPLGQARVHVWNEGAAQWTN